MPEVYTWVIHLINQRGDFDEKQLSFGGSRGSQNCPLMHVARLAIFAVHKGDIFYYHPYPLLWTISILYITRNAFTFNQHKMCVILL